MTNATGSRNVLRGPLMNWIVHFKLINLHVARNLDIHFTFEACQPK